MTREEYLKELKNKIQSLTIDEQSEALQYYSDYFDEAGDDEKVINELGNPDEVAAMIIERFANALVKTNGKNDSDEKTEEEKDTSEKNQYGALYYEYDESSVKNLELNFGAAEVVVISGKKYSVETRGILQENFVCRIDSEGTLVVKNLKKLNGLNFWNHERIVRIVPRILVTIPADSSVNKLKVSIGAGDFRAQDICVECRTGKIEVGAGNLIIKNIHGNDVDIRCGMGNAKISGILTGRSNIDCGMGAIKLELQGDVKNYSYDAKVGVGDFKMNDEKHSGVCQSFADVRSENHFSVNCGMGSVSINLHTL